MGGYCHLYDWAMPQSWIPCQLWIACCQKEVWQQFKKWTKNMSGFLFLAPKFYFICTHFCCGNRVKLKQVTPSFDKNSLETQSRHPKSLSYPLNRLGFQGAVGKSWVINGWENYWYRSNRHHTHTANLRTAYINCAICVVKSAPKPYVIYDAIWISLKNWAKWEITRFLRLRFFSETQKIL